MQLLLNKHTEALKPKRMPLPATGICDLHMIKNFQKQVIGFNKTDGRVDPVGKTLSYLNQPSSPLLNSHHSKSNKPIAPIANGSFSAFIDSIELRHFSAEDLTKGFIGL